MNNTDFEQLLEPTKNNQDQFIHGKNMVEEYSLSLEAIRIAKRTSWGGDTEMQVFAIGVEHGIEIGILKCIDFLRNAYETTDRTAANYFADKLDELYKKRQKVNF
jgi:hypothetical protein